MLLLIVVVTENIRYFLRLVPTSFSGEILVLLLKYRFKYFLQVNRQVVTKQQKHDNMHITVRTKVLQCKLSICSDQMVGYILISVDTFSWRSGTRRRHLHHLHHRH